LEVGEYPCERISYSLLYSPSRSHFSFGLQFALAAGATVIALTSSPEKIEKVKALGAQHVINYKEVTEWQKEVQKIVR
jgi:D-arabinose 1-dehydrogenase-like Zn-dependent alcohol dehydrogenase